MFKMLNTKPAAALGLMTARIPMGLYFAIAGYYKIAGQGSIEQFVANNIAKVPTAFPEPMGRTYLYAMPFLELAVGAMLVLGLFTRLAGIIGTFLLITIMYAVTGIHSTVGPFHPNVIYLGLTLTAMLVGGGEMSVDGSILNKASAPAGK
jgi:thiosulfate dehydrogenase [quinone] large subunit